MQGHALSPVLASPIRLGPELDGGPDQVLANVPEPAGAVPSYPAERLSRCLGVTGQAAPKIAAGTDQLAAAHFAQGFANLSDCL